MFNIDLVGGSKFDAAMTMKCSSGGARQCRGREERKNQHYLLQSGSAGFRLWSTRHYSSRLVGFGPMTSSIGIRELISRSVQHGAGRSCAMTQCAFKKAHDARVWSGFYSPPIKLGPSALGPSTCCT